MWPDDDLYIPDFFHLEADDQDDGQVNVYYNYTMEVVKPPQISLDAWFHENIESSLNSFDYRSRSLQNFLEEINELNTLSSLGYPHGSENEDFTIGGITVASPLDYINGALAWVKNVVENNNNNNSGRFSKSFRSHVKRAAVYLYHSYAILVVFYEEVGIGFSDPTDLEGDFKHFMFFCLFYNLLEGDDNDGDSSSDPGIVLRSYYANPDTISNWQIQVSEYRWKTEHGKTFLKELNAVTVGDRGAWNRSKLMIVGQGRAGKTALVRSFLGEKFLPEWESTVGASLKQTTTNIGSSSSSKWNPMDENNKTGFASDHAVQMALSKMKGGNNKETEKKNGKPQNKTQKHKNTGKSVRRNLKGKSKSGRRSLHGLFRRASNANSNNKNPQQVNTDEIETMEIHDTGSRSNSESDWYYSDDDNDGVPKMSHARLKDMPLIDNDEIMRKYDSKLIALLDNDNATSGREKNKKERDFLSFTIWDYGGQTVFYTLHHLFLTPHGVYVLVFDLRHFLSEEGYDESDAAEYLAFWLHSVSLHAPDAPIFMVGTFLDHLNKGQDEDKFKKLKQIENKISKLVCFQKLQSRIVKNYNAGLKLSFFPIDNTSGSASEGVKLLRRAIVQTTKNQAYVKRQVSLRWMKCLDLILEEQEDPIENSKGIFKGTSSHIRRSRSDSRKKSHRAKANFVRLNRAVELAASVGITSRVEIDIMLGMFHDLGVILHLKSTQTLNDIITTNPQWLIDAISQVIRDDNIHPFSDEKIEQVGLAQDVQALFSDGLASLDLLEHLWNKQHVEYLLELMRETLLLSDWPYGRKDQPTFLIPSLLINSSKQITAEEMTGNFITCVFDFSNGFLPIGIFQRLICLLVGVSARMNTLGKTENENEKVKNSNFVDIQPELSKDAAKVWFRNFGYIILHQNEMKIFMHIEKPEYSGRHLSIIRSLLRKVENDAIGRRSKLEYFCFLENGEQEKSFVSFADAKKQLLKPWFENKNANKKKREEISLLSESNPNIYNQEAVSLNAFLDNF